MSENETNRWIAVEPGYQQPKDSEVVLVTVRRATGAGRQSARALLRGPAAIGFCPPDGDQTGSGSWGDRLAAHARAGMQDGEVANA